MLRALLLPSEWLLVLAVPHIDWIEWFIEPVRFKVGDESCCGSILSQQRFKKIPT